MQLESVSTFVLKVLDVMLAKPQIVYVLQKELYQNSKWIIVYLSCISPRMGISHELRKQLVHVHISADIRSQEYTFKAFWSILAPFLLRICDVNIT